MTPGPTILLQKRCVARDYIDKEMVLVESILTRGIHKQSDNSAESIRRSMEAEKGGIHESFFECETR